MSNLQAPPYVLIYDLSDDRERRRVAGLLQGYGFRVQWSAFECRLTRADRQRLLQRLQAMELRTGDIRIYRLYDGARHITIGSNGARSAPDDCHAFCA